MKEYNGYPNWETWIVNLWMGDDLAEVVQRLKEDEDDLIHDNYELGTYLKEQVLVWRDELYPDMPETSDLFSDLIRAALQDVDWRNLADQYLNS